MNALNVFVDTSRVNRLLDLETEDRKLDTTYEEDRANLSVIIQSYVKSGKVKLLVNPSVKDEIEKTQDYERRIELLRKFNQYYFTPYNKTVFPFSFPAEFVTEEEESVLADLRKRISGFAKDEKIFLDAKANVEVDILLTTDRQHLADGRENGPSRQEKALSTPEVQVFTPKRLLEHLRATL